MCEKAEVKLYILIARWMPIYEKEIIDIPCYTDSMKSRYVTLKIQGAGNLLA